MCSSCFARLEEWIRRSLDTESADTCRLSAFVISRIDSCNSVVRVTEVLPFRKSIISKVQPWLDPSAPLRVALAVRSSAGELQARNHRPPMPKAHGSQVSYGLLYANANARRCKSSTTSFCQSFKFEVSSVLALTSTIISIILGRHWYARSRKSRPCNGFGNMLLRVRICRIYY